MPKSRIRIGFLLPHFSTGGVERVILNLLRRLDRARFQPVLLLLKRRGDLLDQVPADVPIDDLGGARTILAIPRLRRCFKRQSIAVVYAGTNATNLGAIVAAATMRDPPIVIVSEHTPLRRYWSSAKWPRFRSAAMKLLYPRAWAIVAPIAEIAAEIREFLPLQEDMVHVLANPIIDGADIASLEAHSPLTADGEITLVAAGRLETVKGFDILLNAMGRLDGALADSQLVILGEGPERRRLETMIVELGLNGRVHLPGRVPNPEDYYRKAFAVVVSSRFESGPNVLVEAMSVGTPVISSDCPFGPRRILLNGEAGMLVAPEDPGAIAAAVMRLFEDQHLHARYREKGLLRARDFTTDTALPPYDRLFAAASGSCNAS